MTTPDSRLAKPENSKTIKDAAYTACDIGRKLGGPAPVTVEVLEVACGAANAVARQLNKLCGRIIDRTGRGAEIAKLRAENAELLALVQKMAGLVDGLDRGSVVAGCAALAVANSARDVLAVKGGAA